MTNKPSEHPIKKFIMMWFWRVQQISLVTTLLLMAMSLALQVAAHIAWRFKWEYSGIVMTTTILAGAILLAGYIWDRRLRMWQEQSVVMVERNPFYKEKLSAKEITIFMERDYHMLKALGMDEQAEKWKAWSIDQMRRDGVLEAGVMELRSKFFEERKS